MKRIFLVFAILVLMAVNALAAARTGSFSSKVVQTQYNEFVEITAAIVFDTDNSFAALALFMNDADQTNGRIADLSGFFLHSISVYFGNPAPTINSDITLLEHTSSGKDILVGAGTDMLDAATNNYFTTLVGTLPHPVPVFGPLYLVITNNAVNVAAATIVFKFIRRN
jgi:hypothetical protein